jgi:hypothetical protein
MSFNKYHIICFVGAIILPFIIPMVPNFNPRLTVYFSLVGMMLIFGLFLFAQKIEMLKGEQK